MVKNHQQQEQILALLLMKFKLNPTESFKIIQEWIQNNSDENYEVLENCLKNDLVKIENGSVISLYDENITTLVNDLRGKNGIEIKDRRYKLTNYPQCFIGTEAVQWIRIKYSLSESDAIREGQKLIKLKIIHHVADDHDFENDYFFYRFYMDE